MKITWLYNIGVCCFLLVGQNAVAITHYTQFGRYLSVTNAPLRHDIYGLRTIVQRDFPAQIQTVGQAIRYTLKDTAYHLVPMSHTSPAVKNMYQQVLPMYSRTIGPVPLSEALLSLSGKVYQLVIDPVHRLLTYKVRAAYQRL